MNYAFKGREEGEKNVKNTKTNSKKQTVQGFKYDKIVSFYETDYTVALLNGKAGLIDLDGNPLTEFIYDDLTDYFIGAQDYDFDDEKLDSWFIEKDYCLMRLNSKWGLLNNKGEIIIDFQCKRKISVYESDEFSLRLVHADKMDVLFNKDWNKVGNEKEYDAIIPYQLNTVLVYEKDNLYGLMDPAGKIIIKAKYDEISYEIKDQMFVVKDKNEIKIINIKGKAMLDSTFIYRYSSDLSTCIVAEDKNNKWGVIDIKNKKIVIEFIYDNIKLCPSKNLCINFVTMLDGKQALFNEDGVRVA